MPRPKKNTRPRAIEGVTPPRQGRSRETYEVLLDGAERLLEDADFAALRIEDVLASTGTSIGSFYARFEGMNGLRAALFDRYRADLEELAARGRPDASIPPTLEARARAEVRHRIRRYRSRRGLMRAVVLETRRSSGELSELTRLTREVTRGIVEFFRPCFGEIGHTDPASAVLRGTYFVAAICRDRILFGDALHARSVGIALSALEDELTDLLVRQLRG